MKIYLAGPMRNIPQFNFPAFHAAAAALRAQGHEVFNPAERDIAAHGDIATENKTGNEDEAAAKHGFNLREALAADMAYICLHADAIALLPGWNKSTGATAERATAIALHLPVLFLDPGKNYALCE